jgi:hypothetical protein
MLWGFVSRRLWVWRKSTASYDDAGWLVFWNYLDIRQICAANPQEQVWQTLISSLSASHRKKNNGNRIFFIQNGNQNSVLELGHEFHCSLRKKTYWNHTHSCYHEPVRPTLLKTFTKPKENLSKNTRRKNKNFCVAVFSFLVWWDLIFKLKLQTSCFCWFLVTKQEFVFAMQGFISG